MDKLVSSLSSFSLEDPWQLWIYECNDFPKHQCHYRYQHLEKLKHLIKNTCDESGDRWMNYLKKDCSYKTAQTMIRSIQFAVNRKEDNLLPSQLAKYICGLMIFNKKHGRAFFREGIPPNYEDPQNNKGGNFQLLLLGTTGNIQLLKEFDKIFIICIKNLVNNDGNIDKRLNGIFLRCEINPGKFIKNNIKNYLDLRNLPCMVKIEFWIRDGDEDKLIMSTFVKNIEEQIKKEIKFQNTKMMRNFNFLTNNQRKDNFKKFMETKVKKSRSENDNMWRK
uniref:Uncharacterized protein n=1 Tax=Meloidogyne hapla TaxID=6305 RepID=A0A1I8BXJ6_MELHA